MKTFHLALMLFHNFVTFYVQIEIVLLIVIMPNLSMHSLFMVYYTFLLVTKVTLGHGDLLFHFSSCYFVYNDNDNHNEYILQFLQVAYIHNLQIMELCKYKLWEKV